MSVLEAVCAEWREAVENIINNTETDWQDVFSYHKWLQDRYGVSPDAFGNRVVKYLGDR